MINRHYITSESVSCGHPDKVADQISDTILDACLSQDPQSRVACETLVTQGMVFLAGEFKTNAQIDAQKLVRQTLREIGYTDTDMGFDANNCAVLNTMHEQSQDIAIGVDANTSKSLGAGDQGMMVGYACDETPQAMPLAFALASNLMLELRKLRNNHILTYLRPDAKTQVTIEYDSIGNAQRLDTVVLSTQHHPEVEQEIIHRDMQDLIRKVAGNLPIDERTRFLINPTGRFVIGGPTGDCGLTGRKLMVDTYGGLARHGGGAFSGKDPSKVDRSGAYICRYIAKNIIAAKLAKKAEVHIAYCIGRSEPIALRVRTFGSGYIDEEEIEKAIIELVDLTPQGIIDHLDLQRPIYKATAAYGHFGRSDLHLPWERLDLVPILQERFNSMENEISACIQYP